MTKLKSETVRKNKNWNPETIQKVKLSQNSKSEIVKQTKKQWQNSYKIESWQNSNINRTQQLEWQQNPTTHIV